MKRKPLYLANQENKASYYQRTGGKGSSPWKRHLDEHKAACVLSKPFLQHLVCSPGLRHAQRGKGQCGGNHETSKWLCIVFYSKYSELFIYPPNLLFTSAFPNSVNDATFQLLSPNASVILTTFSHISYPIQQQTLQAASWNIIRIRSFHTHSTAATLSKPPGFLTWIIAIAAYLVSLPGSSPPHRLASTQHTK